MTLRKSLHLVLLLAAWMLYAGVGWAMPIANDPWDGAITPATATPSPAPGLTPTAAPTAARTPVYGYRVLAVYPHDPEAFTQGLVYQDGGFYESTGLWGRSSLRRVDLETGEVLQMRSLPDRYFAEGLTLFDGLLFQLTWKSRTGFVYDKATFDLLGAFGYPTEGWGLTHDGRRFIMSDGTPNLYFLDPRSLSRSGKVEVYDENGPVWRLNELEYIDGQVYANVWQTDRIARIDPATGRVTAWIDLTGLLPAEDRARADVLNGIAWDAEGGRLFVTGKLWPWLYQIELVPPAEPAADREQPPAPAEDAPGKGCRRGD